MWIIILIEQNGKSRPSYVVVEYKIKVASQIIGEKTFNF